MQIFKTTIKLKRFLDSCRENNNQIIIEDSEKEYEILSEIKIDIDENNNITMSTLKDRVAHIKKVVFEGKRLVVFSGGDAKDDSALMDEIKAIHQGGGNGSIIGRNCFQRKREDSLALLDQMIQIYKSK